MEIKTFDYGMNAEGVAKLDGKIILVNNALKDEVIEAKIVEDNKNYAIAQLKSLIQSNPNRTKPTCPHFQVCGGCQLQHMNYEEQLNFKSLNIKKTIKKICGLDVEVNPTIACSSPYGYRNKMSFSVNRNSVGLLKHNSQEIVDLNYCPLSTENTNKILQIFKTYLSSIPQDIVKNLVIRDIENQILVGVVAKKALDLKDFYTLLKSSFESIGLYLIINTRNDSVVLSGKVTHVAGIKEIEIRNSGLSYSVDLMGFHQTNMEIQNILYKHVLKYINKDSVVLNGFSGQGLLSSIIAKSAKHVIGIEINKSSHSSAEKLKKDNHISNLTNVCGDFFEELNRLERDTNTLILDPTKKGCGKQVMRAIIGYENIIYISCNPIALCKDLNAIKEHYEIEEITPFDMFPNTCSVETFVKLKKK